MIQLGVPEGLTMFLVWEASRSDIHITKESPL
jgi:hypothetical protein